MAKFKSAYVTGFLPFLLIMLIHSLIGIIGNNIVWIGALTTILTVVAFFAWLSMPQVARTSDLLLPFSLAIVAGVLMTASVYLYTEQTTLFPVAYTAINTLFWLGYIFWYSRFDRPETESLKVGETLPQFFVEELDGTPNRSSKLKGNMALYMFYRGNWCPLCMSQVREIAGMYQELSKRGVEIALISPQSHDNTKKLAEQYKVPFHFWVDTENRAARLLGLEQKNGVPMGIPGYDPETVFPTVIITNEAGEIIFIDATDNYRIRPEPQTFLDILDSYRENPSLAPA